MKGFILMTEFVRIKFIETNLIPLVGQALYLDTALDIPAAEYDELFKNAIFLKGRWITFVGKM